MLCRALMVNENGDKSIAHTNNTNSLHTNATDKMPHSTLNVLKESCLRYAYHTNSFLDDQNPLSFTSKRKEGRQTDGLEHGVGVKGGKVFAGQSPSNPPEFLVFCLFDVLQLHNVLETIIKHAAFVF